MVGVRWGSTVVFFNLEIGSDVVVSLKWYSIISALVELTVIDNKLMSNHVFLEVNW